MKNTSKREEYKVKEETTRGVSSLLVKFYNDETKSQG